MLVKPAYRKCLDVSSGKIQIVRHRDLVHDQIELCAMADTPINKSRSLRIAFAGTPEFAAVALRRLIESEHQICTILTQPDRRSGRGRKITAGAVKQLALQNQFPILQPAKLNGSDASDTLQAAAPDVLVVVAYGLILPRAFLDIARLANINVHASLLPRWRGAAPIERALLAGDSETGISIMELEEALDSGPVYLQERCQITAQDTAGSLRERLAELGAKSLLETLRAIARGNAAAKAQDHSRATYAAKLVKEDTILDWAQPAAVLERKVRALNPRPVAVATLLQTPLRIWEAETIPAAANRPPGAILNAGATGIDVATQDGALRITRLQAPGRKPVAAGDFVNARHEMFDEPDQLS